MSAIHVMRRRPGETTRCYLAPSGAHYLYFAHQQGVDGLAMPNGKPPELMVADRQETGRRRKGWLLLQPPVMFAKIPALGGVSRSLRIPTYQPGMTLERYAAWHAEVARRVQDWQQTGELVAIWDETDYYRVQDGGVLAVEFAALTKTPVSDNPLALLLR